MTKIIGKPIPLIDAREKVTGQAMFSGDFSFPNMLHVKFLRSTEAHARITDIDTALALTLDGVEAIVTGDEVPTTFGVLPISRDEPAAAVEKTRYVGEIVAGVAAVTPEIAQAGVDLITVEYEPLSDFITPEDSLKPYGDAEPIHDHVKNGANIHKIAEMRFNEPEKVIEKSARSITGQYQFAGVTHAFTEPHAAVAKFESDGTLLIITATQVPHYLQRTLADVLDMPLHKVQVKKPALGGGFGGKSDPFPHEILTAFLARKTGRPVKCVFSREEVFINNHGRHPTELTMTIGADNDGIITALDTDIIIDGGAYASFGVVTTYYNGVLLQGPYKFDSFGFRTRRVYTNKPQSGAMRGHGAVNPRYAIECLLDELAHDVGVDPCDLRMNNFLPENTTTIGQLRITSNGVRDCLKAVRRKSDWDKRYGQLPYGKGLGVACGFFISGSALPILWNQYPQTTVHVKLDFDGGLVVFSGASDIGQGSDTMIAQITAEVLGVTMDRVQIQSADTRITPVDLGSYSSRVTFMVGNATKEAAEKMRERIATAVAREHGCQKSDLLFDDCRIVTPDKSVNLSWDEAVELTMSGGGSVVESGSYVSPKMGGKFKGAGAGLSPAYSFGAFISEVTVNPGTGHVKVDKVWGAHDCGRALNPLAVEGQIEGSIHMGLGQALTEEIRYTHGQLVNANFVDYRIPTSLDTPEMDVTIIESNDKEGPFGAKEAGEGPIHPVLPSIGNAIFDAVGVRMRALPITPDKLHRAIMAKEAGGE